MHNASLRLGEQPPLSIAMVRYVGIDAMIAVATVDDMHLSRAAASAAATLASGVLIPLYIDPVGGPDCSGWASLLSTSVAHGSTRA